MADRRSASQPGSAAGSDAESEVSVASPLERAVAVVLTPPQPEPGLGADLPASHTRCINGSARWVLSGAKPGNGIECLMDDSLETWWQSDGKAPHTAQAVFDRRTTVVGVALFVEFGVDESYTPNKIAIRAGMAAGLTTTIREVTLEEPSGWVWIPLALPDPDADLTMPRGVRAGDRSRVGRASSSGEVHCFPFGLKPLRCHVVEVIVPSMHQNGRDTRIRQLRLLGPALSLVAPVLPQPSGMTVVKSGEGGLLHAGAGRASDGTLSGSSAAGTEAEDSPASAAAAVAAALGRVTRAVERAAEIPAGRASPTRRRGGRTAVQFDSLPAMR